MMKHFLAFILLFALHISPVYAASKVGVALTRDPLNRIYEQTGSLENSEGSVVYGSVVVTDLMLKTDGTGATAETPAVQTPQKPTLLEVIQALLKRLTFPKRSL